MKEYLLKQIEWLLLKIKETIASRNIKTEAGELLYLAAQSFLGSDASPLNQADKEYACAESVNNVCEKAFGEPVGGGVSTYRMYYAIVNHRKFVQVTSPMRGDIILSPTGIGGGKNGIKNGHVGIVSDNGKIMSNSSSNGLWELNYDLFSWRYRFSTLGGYKVLFFRRIMV